MHPRLRPLFTFWRRHVALQDQTVPVYAAEAQIRTLRRGLALLLLPAVAIGGALLAHRSTVRGQALRLVVERQIALQTLAVAGHDLGIREVSEKAISTWEDLSLAPEERAQKFLALVAVRDHLRLSRLGLQASLTRAQEARKALPERISDATAWRDPLTGQAFPADLPKDEMVRRLHEIYRHGDDQQAWLGHVAVGAMGSPLPPLTQGLEGR